MREFAFELALCARLEREHRGIVARQLGGGVEDPGGRVVDVVHVAPGPAFDERAAITDERIPRTAIESAVGPGEFRPVTDAIPGPPERARRVAERAVEVGFFERRRRDGRDCVRQVARYPDWFGTLTAIENKPDLGRPGALSRQLRVDASLGLFDRIVLATESYVTGAHRNRIPDPVGIWRFDPETGEREVVREPAALRVEEGGVEPLAEHPGRTEVAVVGPDRKADARRRVAERAYGKGWRTYSFPACERVRPTTDARPHCPWKGRAVDPASECGPDCEGHRPADPPEIDLDAVRAARSDWEADPEGRQRRQAGLSAFGGGEGAGSAYDDRDAGTADGKGRNADGQD